MATLTQTAGLMNLIKALFQNCQEIDAFVLRAWHRVLDRFEYRDLEDAVVDYAAENSKPPTVGDIAIRARGFRDRRLDAERERRPKVEYQQSEAVRAANLARFAGIVKSIPKGVVN